jgi:hypothetical protein
MYKDLKKKTGLGQNSTIRIDYIQLVALNSQQNKTTMDIAGIFKLKKKYAH